MGQKSCARPSQEQDESIRVKDKIPQGGANGEIKNRHTIIPPKFNQLIYGGSKLLPTTPYILKNMFVKTFWKIMIKIMRH